MKKKILLKEAELKKLVPKLLEDVIKEYQFKKSNAEQLEMDFPSEDDTIVSLLEEKYKEIIQEVKRDKYFQLEGWDEEAYDSLNSIYDNKIFPIWREIDSLDTPYSSSERLNIIIDKFSELENVIVTCLETYKEWKTLNEEFVNSTQELKNLPDK